MMGSSLFATTYQWAGALTGNFNDGSQWTPTFIGAPGYGNECDIETPGAVVTQTADTWIGQLMVGSASGVPAVLNITHRVANNGGTVCAGASWNYHNARGTINHTAGQVDPQYNDSLSQWILVGCATTSGNIGTYNFGGASPGPSIVATASAAAGIAIGGGPSNTGVMSLSGYGTINTAAPIFIGTRDCWGQGGGKGTLNITGGNLSINAGAFYAGGHVLSAASPPVQWAAGNSNALLHVTIDSTGISAINAPTVQIDSAATFAVSLSGVTPTIGDVYTIINSTNPIAGTFAELPEGGYVKSGSTWFTISYLSNKVTLTTVDAPASLPSWLEEGFGYTVGSSIVGQNGGTGFAVGSSWSSPTPDTVVSGLTYPGLVTAGGGGLRASSAWSLSLRGTLPIAGSTYYMSMLVNMHGHETGRFGPELRVAGQDGYMFGRVSGGWGMFAGPNGVFGISNSTGDYKTWTGVTAAADSNTHLLVYKFDSIAKTISLFVDPTVSAGEPSTPSATLSTGGNWTVNLGTTINEIRVYHENSDSIIDELRFGGYWVSVVPAAVATNTYNNWISAYPGLSDSTPTGNPSHDGISNLVKYALDLNPTISAQPAGTHSGNSLSFTKGTMAKADSNIAYSIEESTDLITWGTPTLGSVVYGDTITYTYPSGAAKVFARLKVIQTQ